MKITLKTANGINEALQNLWFRNECSEVELLDAIEDGGNDPALIERNLRALRLNEKIRFQRRTASGLRFQTTDPWGNHSYLSIEF